MNYNKTLAVTGGLGGIPLLMQFRTIAVIALVTFAIALSISLFWRRNKNIGE